MLQDLAHGRATEVDVVNGGVTQRGRARGIPTPFNDRVVELDGGPFAPQAGASVGRLVTVGARPMQ
jgi:Ketopantoate reductase PanE/ApbA C terminal